jgi:hypothetical protein
MTEDEAAWLMDCLYNHNATINEPTKMKNYRVDFYHTLKDILSYGPNAKNTSS